MLEALLVRPAAARSARSRPAVHTDEPSPNGESLASSIAWSKSLTRQIGSAGPKTSSRSIGEPCGGSTTTVGSWNQPFCRRSSPGRPPPATTSPPPDSVRAIWSSLIARWRSECIGPSWTPSSVPIPTRSRLALAAIASMTSSATDAKT